MPGNVIAVDYSENNGGSFTTYYYLRNAQNDVVKIIDGSGNAVIQYTYDSWGKLLSTSGSLAETFGAEQPFRYRGYVYDEETGFYYLQSRYYNPELGRFISADVYLSTGQGVLGHNAYAYCLNNPANGVDPSGHAVVSAQENYWQAMVAGGGVGAIPVPAIPLGSSANGYLIEIAILGLIAIILDLFALKEKVEEGVDTELPDSPTVIYRYGGTNPGNLTPREKDLIDGRGLSFSTIPIPGRPCAVTTIEAINATGILYAVQDGDTHVSVYPVGGTMLDWFIAGSNSAWTLAVKAVVVKWNGVN